MNATPNEFGPVQMLVIGFATDSLSGKVLEELKRLREADIVRLVDLLVVAKDDEGDLAVAGRGHGVRRACRSADRLRHR